MLAEQAWGQWSKQEDPGQVELTDTDRSCLQADRKGSVSRMNFIGMSETAVHRWNFSIFMEVSAFKASASKALQLIEPGPPRLSRTLPYL